MVFGDLETTSAVEENGKKVLAMADYIEREAIMEFPIRKDRCDKEHANEHFIFGIEPSLRSMCSDKVCADCRREFWMQEVEL